MELPIWFVDALTSRRFGGNPAAVVPFKVNRHANRLALDFPVSRVERVPVSGEIVVALENEPDELYSEFQWLAVYRSEDEVRRLAGATSRSGPGELMNR